jgi:hypothetical protein
VVPSNENIAILQPFLDPVKCKIKHIHNIKPEGTYSGFDQSMSLGQRRAPVASWLNPRPNLTLQAIGGDRDCSFGVIQGMMALLRLFVSSDLAQDAPF